jgi:hypothetical protein
VRSEDFFDHDPNSEVFEDEDGYYSHGEEGEEPMLRRETEEVGVSRPLGSRERRERI